MADLQKEIDMQSRPATNEQLTRIWSPWNAPRSKMQPEQKRRILTGTSDNPVERKRFARLRRRFPFLPLERHEYHQALNRATRWSTLKQFAKSTIRLHQDLVERQWAFADADNQASGRIAIYRTTREFQRLMPGFLDRKSPTLEDIALLECRYDAYSLARKEALKALSDLVFKVPGMRTGRELPSGERALGVPNPPNDVPRHLFLARLDALGICSEDRLKEFIRDELPTLSREKRQEFYQMSLKPRHGKEPYAALRVWILDNRPIFEHKDFGWQWIDIRDAAGAAGIGYPPTSLKQWASRNGLRFRMKRGPATLDSSRISRSNSLLTPAPVFGDVLKPIDA
jgi:hypothetical protein